jgi:hypothetical protein
MSAIWRWLPRPRPQVLGEWNQPLVLDLTPMTLILSLQKVHSIDCNDQREAQTDWID